MYFYPCLSTSLKSQLVILKDTEKFMSKFIISVWCYPGDRSWNMNLRRRSSNLSDVGSRRSSDLASRRSSGSTRYSSDLSSDLEELYESFQRQESRQRPAAIKEELSAGAVSGIQDYVSSMVWQCYTRFYPVLFNIIKQFKNLILMV